MVGRPHLLQGRGGDRICIGVVCFLIRRLISAPTARCPTTDVGANGVTDCGRLNKRAPDYTVVAMNK